MEPIRSHSKMKKYLSFIMLSILVLVVFLPTTQALAHQKTPNTYIPTTEDCKTYQRWGEYFNQLPPQRSYLLTPPRPYDFVAKGQSLPEIQQLYRYNLITQTYVVCTAAETQPQNHVIWVK